MEDKELNQLNSQLVGEMAKATPPPPEGLTSKFAELITSVVTPEEYREMVEECEVTGEAVSLKLAKRIMELPRAERKRLSKLFGIPWSHLSK